MNIFQNEDFLIFAVLDNNDIFNYYLATLNIDNFKLLSKYFLVCEDLQDI